MLNLLFIVYLWFLLHFASFCLLSCLLFCWFILSFSSIFDSLSLSLSLSSSFFFYGNLSAKKELRKQILTEEETQKHALSKAKVCALSPLFLWSSFSAKNIPGHCWPGTGCHPSIHDAGLLHAKNIFSFYSLCNKTRNVFVKWDPLPLPKKCRAWNERQIL